MPNTNATHEPLLVTYPIAGQMIGLSRRSLERLAGRGALRTRKIGGRRLVVVASLRELARRDVPHIASEPAEVA